MRHAAFLLLLFSACHPRPATVTDAPSPTPSAPIQAPEDAGTPTPGPLASPEDAGAPVRPITLLVGGDVTLGHNHQKWFDEQVAKGRSREELLAYGFKEVRALGDASDLFVVNLECPFTEGGEKLAKNFNFRARPELVGALLAGGVDAVSLANNHLMDYGAQGLVDTLVTLEAARIPYFGAGRNLAEARKPAVITVGGVRVALLGYFFLGERNIEPPEVYATETTPGVAGHFSDVDVMERMLREDILAAKHQADVVLPFFHWGREGTYVPEPYQVRLAHAAIDAGAAGVLGSHPHVLQAMELHRGAPVVYSLGNFVFGGNWNPRDKRGALWKGRFGPGGYLSSEVFPLRTDRFPELPFQPVPVTGEAAEEVFRLLVNSSATMERLLPELEPWARPAPSPTTGGRE
ncbi:CapA family protein [Myxococcus landrumensis]|uniref:CapA family protein n=1 Tax=Myxococcus landrumensis TaxID=2813577 RepID=A0ABX7N6V8_9BACT|nr:CapA family protein [Myxococcus landrumus]QSQ14460.1 CapA family protein [Myxococcus landrumus]